MLTPRAAPWNWAPVPMVVACLMAHPLWAASFPYLPLLLLYQRFRGLPFKINYLQSSCLPCLGSAPWKTNLTEQLAVALINRWSCLLPSGSKLYGQNTSSFKCFRFYFKMVLRVTWFTSIQKRSPSASVKSPLTPAPLPSSSPYK